MAIFRRMMGWMEFLFNYYTLNSTDLQVLELCSKPLKLHTKLSQFVFAVSHGKMKTLYKASTVQASMI